MTLKNEGDYDRISQGAAIRIEGFSEAVRFSETAYLTLESGEKVELSLTLTPRQREILLAGGMLNYTKNAK
jgi:aconitate hydratase